MSPVLAKRIQTLLPSPTVALDNKAKTLKAQGIPVINLTAGEPDFDTPEHIKKEVTQALAKGMTKYSAPQGLPLLRKAIAEKFNKDNNIPYDPSEIVIGAGAKQLLYTVFQVLCNPGDEVIVTTPTWSTFVEQIKLAGGQPILVNLQPPFRLTAKDITQKLSKKTKIILLNSPSNPTGAMIDKKELQQIADLVVKHNLWVISDEIYEKLIYQGSHVSIASLNAKMKNQTITMNGFSKSYAMTGWRLGYAGGPTEVIKTITSMQSQTLGNIPVFIQQAAITALTDKQTSVTTMHKAFSDRRSFLVKAFEKIPELSFTPPEGAFYFYISVEKLLGKKYKTASEWCEALLEKENVAVVPGEAFLYPGYFRLSFAASMEDLTKAVEKIRRFIAL
jgi:aspartate aminotransferase